MSNALIHRGPDDQDIWCCPRTGITMAHRRLSIIDLSRAGRQPMQSASERYVLVFNGEIYNHLALRTELETLQLSPAWQGSSDTETLLACIDAWGLKRTLQKCYGMFALALWDCIEQALTFARDRLGEKPLYYGQQNGTLLFSSELKSLIFHPAFRGEIDRNALSLYMRYAYIPAPYSIYRNIYKLLPGCIVTFDAPRAHAQPIQYWDAHAVIEQSITKPFAGSPEEAVDALEALLLDSIKQQMIADVPLGSFLSGGIDSSAITALMQAQSSRPIRTFSIGYHEEAYNEAVHAKAVSKHLGTDHTEVYVTEKDALDVIPNLPVIYCEPFADSSQIPTYLVSHIARQHVSVSLSGDGGDELFGGYNRYILGNRLWHWLSTIPLPLRRVISTGIMKISPAAYDSLLNPVQRLMPTRLTQAMIGDKLHKTARVMSVRTHHELYRMLTSQWNAPEQVVLNSTEPILVLTDPDNEPRTDGFVHRMMALDLLSYLPDDILCKVDRAAMAVSLETRTPYLDHRVVEFAWSLPLNYKLRNGVGKWPLRQVLYRYVPPTLIDRPKMGFGIPIGQWLRGPLRSWAEDLLDETRLTREGYLNPEPIQQKWQEHISGRFNRQHLLWNVLMFQAWLANSQSM